MSKFTSGKWIVKKLLTTWGVFAVNEGERKPVADCLEEADARLIAAALEMYEVLKDVRPLEAGSASNLAPSARTV